MTMQAGTGGSGAGGVMGAGNPVVGGTVLRIPAVQSPNFSPGVAGWALNADGTASFNGLTITITTSTQGLFVYSGTPAAGSLILSVAAANGTDAYGNAYTAGLNINHGNLLNGTLLMRATDGGTILAQTDPAPKIALNPGSAVDVVSAGSISPTAGATGAKPSLSMFSPTKNVQQSSLTLTGSAPAGTGDTAALLSAAIVELGAATRILLDAPISFDGGTTNFVIKSGSAAPTTSAAGVFTIATGLTAITNVVAWNGDGVARPNVLVAKTGTSGGSFTGVATLANTGATVNGVPVRVEWIALGTP